MSLQDIIRERAALQHQNELNSDNIVPALVSIANNVTSSLIKRRDEEKASLALQAKEKRDLDSTIATENRKMKNDRITKIFDESRKKSEKIFNEKQEQLQIESNFIRSVEQIKQLSNAGSAGTSGKFNVKQKFKINESGRLIPSTSVEESSAVDQLSAEIAGGLHTTPESVVRAGIAKSADPNKLMSLAKLTAQPGILGSTGDRQVTSSGEEIVSTEDVIGSTSSLDGFESPGFEFTTDAFGRQQLRAKPLQRISRADINADLKASMEREDVLIKREEESKRKKLAGDSIISKARSSLDSIKEVRKGMKYFGIRSLQPTIPGGEKANWEANLDKLLATNVINLMAEMKNVSKTGATGFGPLNEGELKILKDGSTALKAKLHRDDAKREIDKMEEVLNKVLPVFAINPTTNERLMTTDGGKTWQKTQ